ncbi:MAG: type III-B CRISPR module RAMP protein Cmr6 [Acidobacteriota bacterium]|jgi:CRISPR-associated protein Cmr6
MTMGAPRYCGTEAAQGPPGHRFRLYLDVWHDGFEVRERGGRPRLLREAAGFQELAGLAQLQPRDQKLVKDLRGRQARLAALAGAWTLEARAVAPFTTGLGNEHPLENGFAFLDPYGLPYLPGSGVKGAVRRAAEELALFEPDPEGWSIPAVWWLFGFDPGSGCFTAPGDEPEVVREERRHWQEALQSRLAGPAEGARELLRDFLALALGTPGLDADQAGARVLSWVEEGSTTRRQLAEIHTRGALEFWDVIPEPADGKLRVDILNPHHNHYYQRGEAPGDWGDPKLVHFLTLPPGTAFAFIVRFRPPLQWPERVRTYFEAAEHGLPRWQRLLAAALAFAFDWLGFGAKTAVGYGRMAWPSQSPRHGDGAHAPAPTQRGESPAHGEGTAAPAPPARTAVSTPGPAAGVDAELAAIAQRILDIPAAQDLKAEAEALANELARRHRHPRAAALAVQLWTAVKKKTWLADHLRRRAPTFFELVRQGGGA